jgi:hypothetical protein
LKFILWADATFRGINLFLKDDHREKTMDFFVLPPVDNIILITSIINIVGVFLLFFLAGLSPHLTLQSHYW